MIILISGASRTGKTLLAKRLLCRFGYPYLSIDHLKMGLIRSGQTDLTPESSDRALTSYLWPIAREIVKTAVENHQNLIVEGCYIPFSWQSDFELRYLTDIRYVCLIMTERYLRAHMDNVRRYADVIEIRLDAEAPDLETMLRDNARALLECRRLDLPYVLIDDVYDIDPHKLPWWTAAAAQA